MTVRTDPNLDPVPEQSKASYRAGREPSFTAMWRACLRNTHATAHASPIFIDTRSVQLVPADVCERVRSVMDGFSQETADAIVLMSVIRHRVLAERLPDANDRGGRQLVILGAGLDTTAFAPGFGRESQHAPRKPHARHFRAAQRRPGSASARKNARISAIVASSRCSTARVNSTRSLAPSASTTNPCVGRTPYTSSTRKHCAAT
jgi:hypothetical protein